MRSVTGGSLQSAAPDPLDASVLTLFCSNFVDAIGT